MNFDTEDIVKELGIGELSPKEREEILDELDVRTGAAISEKLDERQLEEYQGIIDGNQTIIDAWLDQNVPDYKNSAIYKEVQAGFSDDPEKIPGDKVVASIAWIEKNVPDIKEIVDSVREEYKEELRARNV